MWQIGNVKIENQVVMAPMAGISNSAYRKIIKEMGAGLVYAEMVSDKAISYGNEKTINMLYMEECERPIAQQIFGSDKQSFIMAAKYIEETMHPDIIDINMGCPVPKVAVRSQAGSALLKNPQKIYEIIKAIVEMVKVPVTVKIRSGWDSNSINAVEIAKVTEKAGASAIIVHPRTRAQGYSGNADWNVIKAVKQSVKIPVIGNGDIKSCYDAKRMLEETGCDAIMIGRGLLGNPWLVRECIEYLEKGKEPIMITKQAKIDMIKKHYTYLIKTKTEKTSLLEMRMFIPWYLKGMPKSNDVKKKIYEANNFNEIMTILEQYGREEI